MVPESSKRHGDSETKDYIGEFSTEYVNQEIFRLFDVTGDGKISLVDL